MSSLDVAAGFRAAFARSLSTHGRRWALRVLAFLSIPSPQTDPGASHRCVPICAGHYGFKADMAAYDCFQFPTPLVAKSNIVSERPIDFAFRGHKSDRKVDIAVRP
jgi:hypothetical protein